MAQYSSIEWTNATWNPTVGCSHISTGCAHCYAERMARRLAAIAAGARADGRNPGRAANYLEVLDNQGRWNGRVHCDHSALRDPYRWAKPRMVFVNSMSDLFHEDIPREFVHQCFEVMAACDRHVFQVLTKRAERAAQLSPELPWPENIWMGATVESAGEIERINALREIGAHVRFLSLEPLLGPMPEFCLDGIDWVIVGGESGPQARPMRREWVVSIQRFCEEAQVPFFFKQWGGHNKKRAGRMLDGKTWNAMPKPINGSERKHVDTRSAAAV